MNAPRNHRPPRLAALLVAAALVLAPTPPASADTGTSQRAWSFRALLDGRDIGQHQFSVRRTPEGVEARNVATFDVRFLFINAYRYRFEATERWRGGCLQSLSSKVDVNGERAAVEATLRGRRLVVEHPRGYDEHDGCVMSFAYWNRGILQARELLNAQTGELSPVTVSDLGDESIDAGGRTRTARRYRISGPRLQIDLWYAGDDWVGLEAPTEGGRRLRYVLI
jgi:hypothetical protein